MFLNHPIFTFLDYFDKYPMNHSADFLVEDGEEGTYQSNRKLPTGLRVWVK